MKKYFRVTFLLLFLGTAVLCYFQWQSLEKLRRDNKTLVAQLQEAKTAAESDFGKKFSLIDGEVNQLRVQVKDLPRLRSQVQALRKSTNEITKLLAENQKLKATQPHSVTNPVIKPISFAPATNTSEGVLVPKEN